MGIGEQGLESFMQHIIKQQWLVGALGMLLVAQACAKKQEHQAAKEKGAVVEAKPKIVVKEKQFNFGKVKQGQSVEHVFEIENQGKGDLVLEGAHGSCGCVATVLSAKTIAPGGKGQVKATFSTAGRRGQQTKQIFVISNDPVEHQLTLGVEGEVIVDVAIDPQYLWLKEIKTGEKASREFSLTVPDPEKLKVASVTVEDKRFTVRRKSGDPKGNAVYELEFRGTKKPESVSAEVVVRAEGSSEPATQAGIRLEVVGDLRYPRLVQVFRKKDTPFSMDITFTSRSNKPFVLKRAEDPNKFLKLEIVERKGPNARIRVQLVDENAVIQEGKRFTFTVYTSDKSEPTIELPYMVYQQRPMPRLSRPIAPPLPRPASGTSVPPPK
jgi:hypothetical protein